MARVTVYCFFTFRYPTHEPYHWPRAATLKTIHAMKGAPIRETARNVDDSELDHGGFFTGPANCSHAVHRESDPPRPEA